MINFSLDSESMACIFSEEVEAKMLKENILSKPDPVTHDIVLVGCGGKTTRQKCI